MNKPACAKDIMQDCFSGDASAINAFYDRYKNLIYAAIHDWSKQKCGVASADDIAEIFQSALLELMRDGFTRLRCVRDIEKPEPLIYLISYQHAGRYFKNKWRDESRFVPAETALPDLPVVAPGNYEEELLHTLDAALGSLSEEERMILKMFYWKDLKYKEIADATGLSPTNIGVIITRAKEKMRCLIRKKYPEMAGQL